MASVSQQLETLLQASGKPWQRIEHPRASSAQQAADLRGTPLAIGGKSLVLKLGKRDFGVFVLSGARRFENRLVRHQLGIQRLRFATPEELFALTQLQPGCVPPFGAPLWDLPLFVDANTASQAEIAFSLAEHTLSARMATPDYLAVAKPEAVFDLSSPLAATG